MKRPRKARSPPLVQEEMFVTNDPTVALRMKLQRSEDANKILQEQFDDMRRAYLEIKQQNEMLRRELGQ